MEGETDDAEFPNTVGTAAERNNAVYSDALNSNASVLPDGNNSNLLDGLSAPSEFKDSFRNSAALKTPTASGGGKSSGGLGGFFRKIFKK